MPLPRFRLVLHRWITVLLQSAFAGIAAAAIIVIFAKTFEGIASSIAKLETSGASLLTMTCVATLCLIGTKGRPRAAMGLRYFLVNPPIWVSIAFGLLFAISLIGTVFDGSAKLFGEITIAGLFAGLAIGFVTLWTGKPFPSEPVLVPLRTLPLNAPERIELWLNTDDEPVAHPQYDFFNRCQYAIRILRRLDHEVTRGGSGPTFSVQGVAGAGKSSIFCLMQHFLAHSEELQERLAQEAKEFPTPEGVKHLTISRDLSGLKALRLIRISAWKYSSADALIHGVLESIVERIRQETDAYSIAGASREYVATISEGGGLMASLARLLTIGTNSPDSIIERIANLLAVTGLRVVVWLDDLERFSQRDAVDTHAVQALLARFRSVSNISFILATGEGLSATPIDQSKLATFVEFIPTLSEREVGNILQIFRQHHAKRYRDIDPAPNRSSADLDLLGNPNARHMKAMNSARAICMILNTPRALKNALRRVRDAWDCLHGEVILDELLLLSALRESGKLIQLTVGKENDYGQNGISQQINVFDFMLQCDDLLRSERLTRESVGLRESALRKMLSANQEPESRVLHALFQNQFAAPQSVSKREPTDYLARMLAEAHADPVTDQQVIREIIRNRSESDGSPATIDSLLVTWMLNSDFASRKIVQFRTLLAGEPLLRFVDAVVLSILDRPDVSHLAFTSFNRSRPLGALAQLDSILASGAFDAREQVNRAIALCARAADKNLSILIGLAKHLAGHTVQYPDGSVVEPAVELKKAIVAQLLDRYSEESNADALATVIPELAPWTLHWIIRQHWRREPVLRPKPSEWAPLARTLLRALERHPRKLGVPFLILLSSEAGPEIDTDSSSQTDGGFQNDPYSSGKTIDVQFVSEMFGELAASAITAAQTALVITEDHAARAVAISVINSAREL